MRHRLDIRQLESFVAVAEELHFRRAAERLNISQSALSEKVSSLEKEVGVPLLFRTTRQVSLTQAGAEFLRDANSILADLERSISNARRRAERGLDSIRVGGVDEAISMLLPSALVEFKKSCPDIHVQVVEISSSDHHTWELMNHRTDVAFIRTPATDDYVTSELLYRQEVAIVVSDAHDLADQKFLMPRDIINENIVGFPKYARPILHDLLWSGFRALGAQPNVVCEVIDKSTLLHLVAHDLGIALVPSWVSAISPPGLTFIPYQPRSVFVDLYVAHRENEKSKTVEKFVEAARAAAMASQSN